MCSGCLYPHSPNPRVASVSPSPLHEQTSYTTTVIHPEVGIQLSQREQIYPIKNCMSETMCYTGILCSKGNDTHFQGIKTFLED